MSLFHLVATVSLILCAATAALFVHSGFRYVYLSVGATPSRAHWNLGSARGRIYCDEWEQARHGGDLMYAVDAGLLQRQDATQLGDVLTGGAEGRHSDRDITIFDSTGLAIQDLAIALAAMERVDELDLSAVEV